MVPSEAPTIQAGLDSAVHGDTVLVACGTYVEPWTPLKSGVVLRSETGRPDCVTMDMGNCGFVYADCVDSTAALEGITITNGQAEMGGGFLCINSSPSVTDCRFQGNYADREGGGVACDGFSDPVFTRCEFSDNGALEGGGIHCGPGTAPTFIDCTFLRNAAIRGGGLVAVSATVTLERCRFFDNVASVSAGMYVNGSSALLSFCTFENNIGDRTLSCFHSRTYTSLTNCTFSGNDGPGIWTANGAEVNVSRTIIAFSTEHEAVRCDQISVVSLGCSDLFGNAGGDWTGKIAEYEGVLGNISEDPLFCDRGGGDLRLSPGSSCAPYSAPNPMCWLIGARAVRWGSSSEITDPSDVPEDPGGEVSGGAHYRATADSFAGDESEPSGASGIPAAPEFEGAAPGEFFLGPAAPNPFHPVTEIPYGIPVGVRPAHVELAVFDPTGRRVRTLVNGEQRAGTYRVSWSGRDDQARPVASGVYFYRIKAGNHVAMRRIVLVR